MQVFGLQRQVYQAARAASRLAAEPGDSEAARRDALRRWQGARADAYGFADGLRRLPAFDHPPHHCLST